MHYYRDLPIELHDNYVFSPYIQYYIYMPGFVCIYVYKCSIIYLRLYYREGVRKNAVVYMYIASEICHCGSYMGTLFGQGGPFSPLRELP